jgi:hypothetical protein
MSQRHIDPSTRPHGQRGKQQPPVPAAEEPQPHHKPKADKAADKDGE